jgi:response regulator RpfG family c-di-GMP phosphodiesterase
MPFLRDCGYYVVEAASTDEAITILQNTNTPIDVVLSEIDIPGSMNGFGFAQWARSVRPELKNLLLRSGVFMPDSPLSTTDPDVVAR